MDVLQAFEKMHAELPDDCKDLVLAAQARTLAEALTATRQLRELSSLSRELRETMRELGDAVEGAKKRGDIVDQLKARRADRSSAAKTRTASRKAIGQPGS